jgi:O-antigen/teichoic acid export membrane protein
VAARHVEGVVRLRLSPSAAFVDQVLSNASNAAVVLAVARLATPEEFGRFTVAYATVVVLVTVVRSAFGTYVSNARAEGGEVVRQETARALAAVLLLSPLAVLTIMLASLVAGSNGLSSLGFLAIAAPFVLLQDALRTAAVALGAAVKACYSDALWLLFSIGAFALSVSAAASVGLCLALWALGACCSALLLSATLAVYPRTHGVNEWLRRSAWPRIHLASGTIVSGVSVPLAFAIFARAGGAEGVAAMGGAGQLMAPVNTLTGFVGLTALASVATLAAEVKWRWLRRTAVLLAIVAMAWGFLLMALPDSLGEWLLGATWSSTQQILPLVSVQYSLSGLAYGNALYLMARSFSRMSMYLAMIAGVVRVSVVSAIAQWFHGPLALAGAELAVMCLWLAAAAVLARRARAT